MADIVLRPRDIEELTPLAEALMQSGLFRDIEKVAQAGVKVLAGRELGLAPVESMRSLHIVEGKIELSADLLATRVKQHPSYDYRVRSLSNEGAAIEFFQDGESLGISEFTDADRERAGLALKSAKGYPSTWAKYPRSMFFARAMSNGVAWFCPDVASGGRLYVNGEIDPDNEHPPLVITDDDVRAIAREVDPITGEITEPVKGSDGQTASVEPETSSEPEAVGTSGSDTTSAAAVDGAASEPESTPGAAADDGPGVDVQREAPGPVVHDRTHIPFLAQSPTDRKLRNCTVDGCTWTGTAAEVKAFAEAGAA